MKRPTNCPRCGKRLISHDVTYHSAIFKDGIRRDYLLTIDCPRCRDHVFERARKTHDLDWILKWDEWVIVPPIREKVPKYDSILID